MRKADFVATVERMKISMAREDVNKVWNYIDSAQKGFIDLPELNVAFQNRISNFSKSAEKAVELIAVEQYKNQEVAKDTADGNFGVTKPRYNGSNTTRIEKSNNGVRSPLINKSIGHIYGIKNLPSDHIDSVV